MHGKKTLLWLLVFGCVVMGVLFWLYGCDRTLKQWGVPVLTPHFADVRGIIAGGESRRAGYDPLFNNPYDPWKRKLNYPRTWGNVFAALGANQNQAAYWGSAFILLFLAGVFLFSEKIDNITALFLAVSIFSPAVLFGLGRANCDLLIFFLLAVVLVSVRWSSTVAMLLLVAGVFLKLYPIFGVSVLLRESRNKFIMLVLVSFVLVAVYAGLTFRDLLQVVATTPREVETSFGSEVVWMFVRGNFPNHPALGAATGILTCLALLFLFFRAIRANRPGDRLAAGGESCHLDAFRMGSAVYLGLFLWGTNYEYKLMFLLFAIPQLVFWMRHGLRRITVVAKTTVAVMMVSFWYLAFYFAKGTPFYYWGVFFIAQSAEWLLFGGLLYLFVYSLPEWAGVKRPISLR